MQYYHDWYSHTQGIMVSCVCRVFSLVHLSGKLMRRNAVESCLRPSGVSSNNYYEPQKGELIECVASI